jgi:hypothetical protein
MTSRRIHLVVGTFVAAALTACNARADQPTPATVSVQRIGRDSIGARFRVCNDGFQPIRRVEFTAGGAGFSLDTLLGQAHCAELARAVDAALPDSARPVVTRVEGR